MVMPRSRSMSIESSTCSTISRSAIVPVSWMSRSASVDLPWSICAIMAKLRMLSIGWAVMGSGIAGRDWERNRPSSIRDAHHQTFDVVLLGDRRELVHDPADQVIAHDCRQRVVIVAGRHEVVQLVVAG